MSRSRHAKNINITFSIPSETHALLHTLIEKHRLSRFVVKALEQALLAEQDSLKQEYLAAEKDPDRKAVIKDWFSFDSQSL